MERFKLFLLLCLTAVVAMKISGNTAEAAVEDTLVMNNKTLKIIPLSDNSSSVTKLVISNSLITLSEVDRLALASYPTLVELRLEGNLVTAISAQYFSVVPHLRVLSLSRNNLSSLNPKAFVGLNGLTTLDLSNNLLTSLPPHLFTGLNNLQVLNLQQNPWNCSCPHLIGIDEVKAAVNTGEPRVTCASPQQQVGNDLLNATAECYPSPSNSFTTAPQKPPTPVNSQWTWSSSTMLKATLLSSQNHTIKIDKRPVLSNTWKFTICVAALALATSMLIVLAFKGPSWYKLYHNYRHRQLEQERDEEDVVSTVQFSEMGRYRTHQTFTFNHREIEENEDEYFEDPYIKRDIQRSRIF